MENNINALLIWFTLRKNDDRMYQKMLETISFFNVWPTAKCKGFQMSCNGTDIQIL